MKVNVKNIEWTNEPVLSNDMPKNITLEIDEDLLMDDSPETLRDAVDFEISECFVFTPHKIGSIEKVEEELMQRISYSDECAFFKKSIYKKEVLDKIDKSKTWDYNKEVELKTNAFAQIKAKANNIGYDLSLRNSLNSVDIIKNKKLLFENIDIIAAELMIHNRTELETPQTDEELTASLKAYNEANETKPTTTLIQK